MFTSRITSSSFTVIDEVDVLESIGLKGNRDVLLYRKWHKRPKASTNNSSESVHKYAREMAWVLIQRHQCKQLIMHRPKSNNTPRNANPSSRMANVTFSKDTPMQVYCEPIDQEVVGRHLQGKVLQTVSIPTTHKA